MKLVGFLLKNKIIISCISRSILFYLDWSRIMTYPNRTKYEYGKLIYIFFNVFFRGLNKSTRQKKIDAYAAMVKW